MKRTKEEKNRRMKSKPKPLPSQKPERARWPHPKEPLKPGNRVP